MSDWLARGGTADELERLVAEPANVGQPAERKLYVDWLEERALS